MTVQSYVVQLTKASLWAFRRLTFPNMTIFPTQYNNWEAKFKAWNQESRKNTLKKLSTTKLETRNNRQMTQDHEAIFQCLHNSKP